MDTSIGIDELRCTGCGACTLECHRHLPVYREAEASLDGLECIGCLHCYAVCPQGAVTLQADSGESRRPALAASEPLFDLLSRRRSCRNFLKRRVDNDILTTLALAAAYIPSGGNSHAHRLTVLTGGEMRLHLERALERIYRRRRRLLGSSCLRSLAAPFVNPQMRAFLRDRSYLRRLSYLLEQFAQGEDPVFYRAPAVILVHSRELIPTPREDSILAAYNIVLAAETLGLGSCFVSLAQNAINSSRKLKQILNLEQREQVHAVVALGYPAVQFRRPVPRRPVPAAWSELGGRAS